MIKIKAKLLGKISDKAFTILYTVLFAATIISAFTLHVLKTNRLEREHIYYAKFQEKINELSPKELIGVVDSLLSLNKIHPKVLSIVNQKIKRDFNNYRCDNNSYPAHHYYHSWNTQKSHPYSEDLWKSDSLVYLNLKANDECGYETPFNGVVTSHYGKRDGRMHQGIDLNLYTGDTVRAAFSGKVRLARWQGGYGNCIVIRHYNGLETIYGHLSKHLVRSGDWVDAGEPIGRGGNTGNSRGSHLHLETRFKGRAINPEIFIDFAKGELKNDTLILRKGKKNYIGYLPETYTRKLRQSQYRIALLYPDPTPLKNGNQQGERLFPKTPSSQN